MAAVPQFTAPFPGSVVAEPTYAGALPSWLAPVGSLLDRFEAARERLNLPEPGKHEDLGREVKRASTFPWHPQPRSRPASRSSG